MKIYNNNKQITLNNKVLLIHLLRWNKHTVKTSNMGNNNSNNHNKLLINNKIANNNSNKQVLKIVKIVSGINSNNNHKL